MQIAEQLLAILDRPSETPVPMPPCPCAVCTERRGEEIVCRGCGYRGAPTVERCTCGPAFAAVPCDAHQRRCSHGSAFCPVCWSYAGTGDPTNIAELPWAIIRDIRAAIAGGSGRA